VVGEKIGLRIEGLRAGWQFLCRGAADLSRIAWPEPTLEERVGSCEKVFSLSVSLSWGDGA
jgi:hypothetical protein